MQKRFGVLDFEGFFYNLCMERKKEDTQISYEGAWKMVGQMMKRWREKEEML
ncbi:MAG: hypothetical protein M1127_01235 [Patescibacteria group bacterium]|nr:hypothetical protein [Patescibacteria group bacterium]